MHPLQHPRNAANHQHQPDRHPEGRGGDIEDIEQPVAEPTKHRQHHKRESGARGNRPPIAPELGDASRWIDRSNQQDNCRQHAHVAPSRIGNARSNADSGCC